MKFRFGLKRLKGSFWWHRDLFLEIFGFSTTKGSSREGDQRWSVQWPIARFWVEGRTSMVFIISKERGSRFDS